MPHSLTHTYTRRDCSLTHWTIRWNIASLCFDYLFRPLVLQAMVMLCFCGSNRENMLLLNRKNITCWLDTGLYLCAKELQSLGTRTQSFQTTGIEWTPPSIITGTWGKRTCKTREWYYKQYHSHWERVAETKLSLALGDNTTSFTLKTGVLVWIHLFIISIQVLQSAHSKYKDQQNYILLVSRVLVLWKPEKI